MNLTKKKNEVKNGWTKDKSVPVGGRDLKQDRTRIEQDRAG